MRTSIVLGLLALSIGFFGSAAFAGNVEDCEILKDGYTKGLYGLCIAWHNAGSDNARERILDNYDEKAGPGDPPMPGTEDEVPCPCWDELHLATASEEGVPNDCQISGSDMGVEFSIYEQGSNENAFQFHIQDEFCFRVDPSSAGAFAPITSAEAEATCRAGIQVLVDDDFGGICP